MSESIAFITGLGLGVNIISIITNALLYFWVSIIILIIAGIFDYKERIMINHKEVNENATRHK